ncbi:MAG: hypothetical protein COB36_10960 [Alphaproteobacteria bacterium]|nr:MAG: hypothetical protein COB36_10960 [Alphaproteobacteria bacterium]
MTIEELKDAKYKLEKEIKELIAAFCFETKSEISSVDVDFCDVGGMPYGGRCDGRHYVISHVTVSLDI